jgi:uncharacterized protein YjbI with pentapeptide repeats
MRSLQGLPAGVTALFHGQLSSSRLESDELHVQRDASVNLSFQNLFKANLAGADLRGANFTQANLIRANLFSAVLEGADSSAADLRSSLSLQSDLTHSVTTNTIRPDGQRHM